MKKLFLILLTLTLVTACDNEPLDNDIYNSGNTNGNGNGNGNGNNTSEEALALNSYSFDTNSEVPIFGTIVVNADFFFNSNNKVSTSNIGSTFFGITVNENVTMNRNSNNQIIGFISQSNGTTTNETTVTYSGSQISQIVYNFIEDDIDDYTYNFAYTDNTITRTEVGSSISTVFTLDTSNRIIKKESFDGDISILLENVTYDGNGNCATSVITGEENTSATYNYDSNENPLKDGFSDQYLLSFLNDDYSDDIGSTLAQFHSTNNWISITTPEGSVNLTVNYDSTNRITSRTGSYDLGDGVLINQAESLQYVN